MAAMMIASPVLVAQQSAPIESEAAPGGTSTYHLTINSNVVLTNVVVRDKKTGALITGLKASDFQIFEDKKPQHIISFDYENVNEAAALRDEKTVTGQASIADLLEHNFAASPEQLKDHRLIVMFFDLSSMQDEDIDRAVDAATNYVKNQMQPADLVAMVSMSTGLSMDQDFTSDKAALLRVLAKYSGDDDTGFTNGTTGSTDGTSDDSTSFAADDSEFNSLNTDRELYAIRSIAKSLERVDERKSLLYFSGGLTKNGIENQASLRAATSESAKANMAIYSVDSRGLQAMPPGGDASQGSLRGTGAYSGAGLQSQFNSNFSSQETLATLSSDTGGKAFFDSNDFAPAFQQIQHDTAAYYIIGFRSTNQRQDGTYRHLTVKVDRPDVKLEYRPGYFAPADFKHENSEDREYALEQQMRSPVPATDVDVYLQALYFRERENLFYVPVSVLIPGSQIPFSVVRDKDKASIDILGEVRDAQGIVVGNARQTVKLNLDATQHVEQRNIEYTTGFSLAPGRYHLKFIVRENQTGNMGSFETDIHVPDLKNVPLKMSSVVLATQRTPDPEKHSPNLLVRGGEELVPNLAHVVRPDQHLYFLYEVYEPAHSREQTAADRHANGKEHEGSAAHVLTSIEFLHNGAKVFETPVVTAEAVNVPARDAVAFQFDIPATQLAPGDYVCQVNVIDDAGGSFSFPRLALRMLDSPAPAAASTPVAASAEGGKGPVPAPAP